MQLFNLPLENDPNQTLTYQEILECYNKLADTYPDVFQFSPVGSTDIGEPLHTAVLSTSGEFDPEAIRKSGKLIMLINNGIHPGEPEGIDATVMLLRDVLADPEKRKWFDHIVLVVIPVYNVDGCINRGSFSRANQNGPEAYGFRGNYRNYDLNRDFVKTDSRNAQTFNQIFTTWLPDVFIDNHTSNGADYQYTMTLIGTQHAKLEAPLGNFLNEEMMPYLYADMKARGWESIPYVWGFTETPEGGIIGFVDYARFSTGYAALWNTIGFMPETHMLKPFMDRMWSTYAFMESVIDFVGQHHETIGKARAEAWKNTKEKSTFVLDWAMDTTKWDDITFKGYKAKYKPSAVSGLPRLWYDREEPYEMEIPYHNYFNPKVTVEKPLAYIIPQSWENVIERLKINRVKLQELTEETSIEVESYSIEDFKNREAWEGHYFHHDVKVTTKTMRRTFRKGDLVVPMDQIANRYLIETLEPHAPDSWFAWNFFDPILMQKEYFSAYVFEDLAADFLRENPDVKAELEKARSGDPKLASDARAQLDWVYRHSPWYEPTHRLYPVGRIVTQQNLPLKEHEY